MSALHSSKPFLFSGFSLPLIAPLALTLCPVAATAADDLATALASGKAGLEFRYRYDYVEDEAKPRDANASTLRTRLNYTTGIWQDTAGFVEMDNVSRIGDDRYNDNRNGKTLYATVPDPDGTDMNQAWLRYSGIEKTAVTVGRQRVGFDNHRIIGFTPGRQNEQTLDGLMVEYKGVDKLTASLGFMSRVNTSSGPEPANAAFQPPAERDVELPMVHLRYAASEKLALAVYHFAMDFDQASTLSNATTGLRASGQIPMGDMKFDYVAEAAQQSDHARQPVSYDAGYWHGDFKLTAGRFNVGVGHETLEADSGMRFITPLATLKFHGFAEKFWQTPTGGIRDTWASAGMTVSDWRLMVRHHWLHQETDIESDGRDFARETDFTAFRAFGKHYQVLFVHTLFDVKRGPYGNAAYGPAARFDDTQKTYLALMAKF